MVPTGIFDMVAKTQAGFEQVLADEITAIGGTNVVPMRRAVSFQGDRAVMYKANLWLRTALRVLIPFRTAVASNSDTLYQRALSIDWSAYLTPRDTFVIDCTTSGELHQHSLFASMRVKDAIADQFMASHGLRPSVDLHNPTLRINVHINEADVIFALDTSGDSLHKRGYRLEKNEAPLNEVLAAGLMKLTGWHGERNLTDIMCGSGTLLIEGAWIAMNYAPGLCRGTFGFQNWADFDADLWQSLLEDAKAKMHKPTCLIFGSDISQETVEVAHRNIQRAGLEGIVEVTCQDYHDTRPPAGGGVLVTNPPYGERLYIEEIEAFYAELGDVFKKYYQGFDAWVFSGNLDAIKRIGLRASRKYPLFNATIDCRFNKYELYAGTREQR